MTHDSEWPKLCPICNGFAARGPCWAVHGRTEEEALANYHEAEQRHREIAQRPLPTYEPVMPRLPAQVEKSRAILEEVLAMLDHGEMFMEDIPPSMRQRLRKIFS
jgi:hypothetical protein